MINIEQLLNVEFSRLNKFLDKLLEGLDTIIDTMQRRFHLDEDKQALADFIIV